MFYRPRFLRKVMTVISLSLKSLTGNPAHCPDPGET
jgi:hypothetical protein